MISKGFPKPIKQSLSPCLPPHQEPPIYVFISMDLLILDIWYKWNHTTWGILSLTFYMKHSVFKDRSYRSMSKCFIPLRGWIHDHRVDTRPFVYPFMYPCAFVPFAALTVVNSDAMCGRGLVRVPAFSSLEYIPRSGSSDTF